MPLPDAHFFHDISEGRTVRIYLKSLSLFMLTALNIFSRSTCHGTYLQASEPVPVAELAAALLPLYICPEHGHLARDVTRAFTDVAAAG
jgi:hypothetical protein